MPMEVAGSTSASLTRRQGDASSALRTVRHSLSGAVPGAPSAVRRGWACSRSPGVQGVRAAPPGAKASAMKARRSETPAAARCTARRRGPASAGDARIREPTNQLRRLHARPEARLHADASPHRTTEAQCRHHDQPRMRLHDFQAMHRSALPQRRLRANATRRLHDCAAIRIRADPRLRRPSTSPSGGRRRDREER